MALSKQRFIGVSFGVVGDAVCVVATSAGFSAVNLTGFSTSEALSVLASLAELRDGAQRQQKRGDPRIALVMYDTVVDIELVVKDLTPAQKNILFGLYREKEDRNRDLPIYDCSTPEYKGVVTVDDFKVSLLPGKVLRVARVARQKRAGLVFYDISSHFDYLTLGEAAEKFLKIRHNGRLEKNLLPLWSSGLVEQLAQRCELEAALIVELAEKVRDVVEPLDLKLRQWYGPSAIAARCLHKWGARKQAKRLNEKNSPHELIRAIDCAYFGGRVEAIKLGTVSKVTTFDLNSAYAYAVTLLSQFYSTLKFTREYQAAPFSCWLASYSFPANVSLGPLPTRARTGGVSFRRAGKGYFWWPELDYVLQHYPDCIDVQWGYVCSEEYRPVQFANAVEEVYDYRNRLKAAGEPGENIVRLALANLYGKFSQNTGNAYFQCRAWAGWITSLVRRLLLEAVTGIEDKVICFCQDAVHFTQLQDVPKTIGLGDGLGEWKRKEFASGLYISPGIYTLQRYDQSRKNATRGSNSSMLDFNRIASDLSARQVSELTRLFFVGWKLSQQESVRYGRSYLQEVEESLSLVPSRLQARNYLHGEFDWSQGYKDSLINTRFAGESFRYVPPSDSSLAMRLRLKDRGWV